MRYAVYRKGTPYRYRAFESLADVHAFLDCKRRLLDQAYGHWYADCDLKRVQVRPLWLHRVSLWWPAVAFALFLAFILAYSVHGLLVQ